MDNIYHISNSGLKAAQTRHNVTSHDVANINTDGFRQRDPLQTESKYGGTQISNLKKSQNKNKMSNTDFAVESKEMIINKNSYTANAKVIKVQNQMIGELIDLIS